MNTSSRSASRYRRSRLALLSITALAFGTAPACGETSDEEGDSCGECPPFGARCADGVVSYRYDWIPTCPATATCRVSAHPCTLGCRQEGSKDHQQRELVFMLCEEASIRAAGFPCRHDVDCLTPIGATDTSRLVAESGSGQGGTLGSERYLVCGVDGRCEAADSMAAYADVGSGCTLQTSLEQPGPVLGASVACASGGCLALAGGATEGTCTAGCVAAGDCPAGYECADVLDNRYFTWGWTAQGFSVPRITACVPSVD
jgi:hypothetical protein